MPWKATDTVNLREEFVLKALGKHLPLTRLCEEYGISRTTGHKWMERFRQGGLPALHDMSRRPKASPNALKEDVVCELIRIKNSITSTWGPKKVLRIYENKHGSKDSPSLSSVKRVLDRAGYVRHRRRRRRGETARIKHGVIPKAPNELWTVDFKGWWKTRDRSRCDPLTVRDEFARFVLDLRVMESTGEKAVRPVFEKIFELYGLPNAIRSDNGSPFASPRAPLGLSRLSCWWISLGIRLDRIEPGKPYQNGAHERMHLDIRDELEANPAENLSQSQEVFDEWRHTFNWIRPHESLDMKTPGEIYSPSERSYVPGKVDITYPENWLERRVKSSGCISLSKINIHVSHALAGHIIGLQPVDDRLDVYFDCFRIGYIDLHVLKFLPVMNQKKKRRSRSSSGRLAALRRNQSAIEVPVPDGQSTQKV